MNQTSSIVTGGLGITIATLIPIITWLLKGCEQPIPENLPYVIAAALVAFSHCAVNLVNAWMASKSKPGDVPALPAQPEVQSTDKESS